MNRSRCRLGRVHIVETIGYLIDSNKILYNYKQYQMLSVGGPNAHTTNPRWRTAAILKKKIEKSLYLGKGLTDRREIWQDDANLMNTIRSQKFD